MVKCATFCTSIMAFYTRVNRVLTLTEQNVRRDVTLAGRAMQATILHGLISVLTGKQSRLDAREIFMEGWRDTRT